MRNILLLVVMAPAACALGQFVEFYGGDGDGRGGVSSEMNGLITKGAWTYDDFDHAGGPITALWGNFVTNYARVESAWYEIRSGISRGNGGTLHATGTLANPTYLPTGRVYFGYTERYVKGGVSIPDLPAGRYYLSIQLRALTSSRAFAIETSAADLGPSGDPNPPPAGTPLRNGNSWFNSEHYGSNFIPVTDIEGSGTWDFSFGVEVPEPAGAGLIALGTLALVRRR